MARTDDFAGHEVCGDLGEWINGPSFTVDKFLKKKVMDDESFHPNLDGQELGYAAAVQHALAQTP